MPADNGFRLYDREGLQNTRRDPIQADEDHTIEVAEDRALRRPSMQHIQLMAQSEYLCLERRLRAANQGQTTIYRTLVHLSPSVSRMHLGGL